ncbi:hypothetical protein E3N88_34357 [Mikania micrantha]|uniref:TATA-box-binding protein n=1 Tax=Mikania micrantha TaxID=192012 RepID=A0A5N6LXW4_9ASTR|nr:hypothetical protein E3N88_34357 [Mikania micrantha]
MADQVLEGSQPVDLTKHPSGIIPTLQNIVSTVNLDCKLDLKAIALQARNAEYNPKRFAAVIMRIREPKTTALIFASGKMVCTGAKSEQQSKLAARKYARIIQKLGFPAKFKDFKIQNIVGSCDVKFPIRLEGLAYSHGAFSIPPLTDCPKFRLWTSVTMGHGWQDRCVGWMVRGRDRFCLKQAVRSEMRLILPLRTYILSLLNSERINSGKSSSSTHEIKYRWQVVGRILEMDEMVVKLERGKVEFRV